MNYPRINKIIAAVTLLISFLVYFDTMAPTVSYWDCGEFIATSYSLGVPHPPGSPLFLIVGRVFSMLPVNPDIGFRVNLISPILSALAVMLLYLIIVQVITHWRGRIKTTEDAVIVFGSAVIGALTFAFTDSHWFNAVESEVYAVSTFFTAIVVWLIFHWSEKADEPGHERYILIIAYMIGLATGVHLLNLLTIPFVALIVYFRKLDFEWKSFLIMVALTGITFLVIHNGIIKGIPKMAKFMGIFGLGIVILAIFAAMVWAIITRHQLLSMIFTSMVLILIGYSSYTLIFIRANQNPAINENSPNTISAAISYLEREQYGEIGQFPRKYNGLPPQYEVTGPPASGREYSSAQNRKYMFYNLDKQWQFFWDYQVKKMYWRYFLWQFAGRGPSTDPGVTAFGATARQDGVDWTQFGMPLAFILGLAGMIFHFYRDEKIALSVLTLFFLTGLAVILYLNQDNPQPRERDYSYVGSFLAFSVWIGVGAAAIMEKLKQFVKTPSLSPKLNMAITILLIVLVPGVMLQANYKEHDRSGNYVAWDYSYNLLQSCEPNGILFTNGDNDTFPLWYLQEVEGIRKDVTVANLSLLNTPWYIKQLRDSRPKGERFINLTDNQIRELTSGLTPWKTQNVRIPVLGDSGMVNLEWTLKPTFGGRALKVQDMMILRIIADSKLRYPVYFAVTVSPSNRLGLEEYLTMEGLTFRVNPKKVKSIDPEKMYRNLMTDLGDQTWSEEFVPISKIAFEKDPNVRVWTRDYQEGYMFRNLGNKDVFFNPQIMRLLQNYRSAYMQLAVHHYFKYQEIKKTKGEEAAEEERLMVLLVMDQMEKNIPSETIAMASKDLYFQIGQLYFDVGAPEKLTKILADLLNRRDLTQRDQIRYGYSYLQQLKDADKAASLFEQLYKTFNSIEKEVKARGLEKAGLSQRQWNDWQKNYSEIISALVQAYRQSGREDEAKMVLSDWIARNPQDTRAKQLLEELQGGNNPS